MAANIEIIYLNMQKYCSKNEIIPPCALGGIIQEKCNFYDFHLAVLCLYSNLILQQNAVNVTNITSYNMIYNRNKRKNPQTPCLRGFIWCGWWDLNSTP